jgi:DNA mismatch endonuclease (patch repair protein)
MDAVPAARPTTTPEISARMSVQARRDTQPELALRRRLHALGYRFRVDWPLPGMPRRRADIAFTRRQVAIFVDGCFWHGCPDHNTAPATNAAWWANKLAGNVRRDRETDEHLRAAGWTVLRFWEHDAVDDVVRRVVAVLGSSRADASES